MAGDPRMWGLLLLGLLVGVAPLLAAAALVRQLSQSRDNDRQGALPRAQAVAAERVGSDRLEGGRDHGARKATTVRGRLLLAGVVWAGTALLAGAAMLFLASDGRERQLAATARAVSGQLFTATGPRPVPELHFVDGAGQPRTLTDFHGKVVLLNLWATWCLPCRQEMPALARLQARLGGSHFEVLALATDKKGLPAVRAFYAEIGLQALAIYVDGSERATSQLGALGLPTTLLVDAQGNEIGRAVGPREWDAPAAVAEITRRIGPVSR
jgi:thiol-disulfide isomerase/thioredoxin